MHTLVHAQTNMLLRISTLYQQTQHLSITSQKQVQKLSGLQPKPYSSALHSVEKMLDLSTHVSLRELAVRFGCLEAEHLANEILQKYV